MLTVKTFTFNPFQEHTYVLSDETRECVIIDPGCQTKQEQEELSNYITSNKLTPVRLLNTHCHIDHIMGNHYVSETYKLPLEAHQGDAFLIERLPEFASKYGMHADPSPAIAKLIEPGTPITFGSTTLNTIHVPGHSPGSIVFHSAADNVLIVGDVLFMGGVGRGDLPGGNFDLLIEGIKTKLLTLPDTNKVYSGHGPATTIGHERATNGFLQ